MGDEGPTPMAWTMRQAQIARFALPDALEHDMWADNREMLDVDWWVDQRRDIDCEYNSNKLHGEMWANPERRKHILSDTWMRQPIESKEKGKERWDEGLTMVEINRPPGPF